MNGYMKGIGLFLELEDWKQNVVSKSVQLWEAE